MANRTLTTDVFVPGTTVRAYPVANFPAHTGPSGAPVGDFDAQDTVAADSSFTFEDLQESTAYVAHGQVGGVHRYVAFSTTEDSEYLNGQVAVWNSTTGEFEPGTVSRGPQTAIRSTSFTPAGYVALTAVDIPSLQIQLAVSSGQLVEFWASCTLLKNSVSGSISAIQVVSDESATTLAAAYVTAPSNNGGFAANCYGAIIPTAGTRTFKLQVLAFSNVPTVDGRTVLTVR